MEFRADEVILKQTVLFCDLAVNQTEICFVSVCSDGLRCGVTAR